MKLLQVITDTDRRGAQVFASDLGRALAARGHDVDTVALAPGVNETRLPFDTLGATRLAPATLRALRRRARGRDVVAAHGSSTLPACAAALLGTRVPFVYRQISESLFWAGDRWSRLRVRAYYARASHVVTLASSQGEVLTAHFGVPPAKLSVVPNGVPSTPFGVASPEDRAEARRQLGLPADAPVAVYVGALVPEKGADLAVRGVGAVDGVHLLVVGDGPERGALEALAADVLPARATFAGSLDSAVGAYAASDLVLLPSRGGDSMPAILIEAGFAGLPSVTTDVGAITEVVADGETGLLVPTDDHHAVAEAVARLVGDPAAARAMGEAARARCLARFDIDVVAAQWEDALARAHGTG